MVWAMLDRGTTVAGKMDGKTSPVNFWKLKKTVLNLEKKAMVVFIYA